MLVQDFISSRRKVFSILIVVILLAAIPLTIYLVSQRQEIRQQAAPVVSPDTVIVKVNGEDIKKVDLDNFVINEIGSETSDRQTLTDALDTIIERKILDKALTDNNLSVDQAEVSKRVTTEGFSDIEAYYEILKEKVIMANVKARSAISIGFWIPPTDNNLTDQEKSQIQARLADTAKALNDIQTKLSSGEDPINIAQAVGVSYPSLKPLLAVNGYISEEINDANREIALMPQVYQLNDSSLDQTALNDLFTIPETGAIKIISNTESNRGGSVFKLAEKGNDSGAGSYEDWLSSQKNNLVVPVNPL